MNAGLLNAREEDVDERLEEFTGKKCKNKIKD